MLWQKKNEHIQYNTKLARIIYGPCWLFAVAVVLLIGYSQFDFGRCLFTLKSALLVIVGLDFEIKRRLCAYFV